MTKSGGFWARLGPPVTSYIYIYNCWLKRPRKQNHKNMINIQIIAICDETARLKYWNIILACLQKRDEPSLPNTIRIQLAGARWSWIASPSAGAGAPDQKICDRSSRRSSRKNMAREDFWLARLAEMRISSIGISSASALQVLLQIFPPLITSPNSYPCP